MALTIGELACVIAGSIAGLIIFFSVIGTIFYFCVRFRRKDHRQSEQKLFQHHITRSDTSLSRSSGPRTNGYHCVKADLRIDPRLDPSLDLRLPRVGSNNLWIGHPSPYSTVPSQVFQDMKRNCNNRLSHECTKFPASPGHILYPAQNDKRIYYSQQMIPSICFERDYRFARSGSFMEQYLYAYNYDPYGGEYPKAEKYLDRYCEREVRRTGRNVRRSQSDVTLHSTRRLKYGKERNEAFERRKYSSEFPDSNGEIIMKQQTKGDIHRGNDKAINREKDKKQTLPAPMPQINDILARSSKPSYAIIQESATDSAKLRAIERTSERQMERSLDKRQRKDESSIFISDNIGFLSNRYLYDDLHIRPYQYDGRPSSYDNSIKAQMTTLTDKSREVPANSQNVYDDGIINPPSKEKFCAEVTQSLKTLQQNYSTHYVMDIPDGPAAITATNHSTASKPSSTKDGRKLRTESGNTDIEGNIVTEKAFEFLEGYSDDEGNDCYESGLTIPTRAISR